MVVVVVVVVVIATSTEVIAAIKYLQLIPEIYLLSTDIPQKKPSLKQQLSL